MRATLPCLMSLALYLTAAELPATDFNIGNRDSPALIRALQEAARSPGPHHIALAADGLYTLSLTDSNGLGLPPISTDVIIDGRGAEIRGWTHQPLHFLHVQRGGSAQIRDLTLAEGTDGAVRNYGSLRLERVTISDSRSRGESPIVLNEGNLDLVNSRIEYNLVHSPEGNAALLRNEGRLQAELLVVNGNRITHTQRHPLTAAALWNRGRLRAESVSLADNLLNELLGSVELQAIVNVAGGQLSGSLGTAH